MLIDVCLDLGEVKLTYVVSRTTYVEIDVKDVKLTSVVSKIT